MKGFIQSVFVVIVFWSCAGEGANHQSVSKTNTVEVDSFLLKKASPPRHRNIDQIPKPWPDRILLTWQGDVYTSMTFTWRTDTTVSASFIEIAEATPGVDFKKNKNSIEASFVDVEGYAYPSRYHSGSSSGLKPKTHYAYRVGQKKGWSEWNHFTTPDPEAISFSFIFMGDAQNDLNDTWARVMRAAYSRISQPAFVLHAGDMINHADNDYEWAEWFAGMEPFQKSIPTIVTPGNHEYVKNSDGEKIAFSRYWDPQFNLPNNGPDDLHDRTYSLNYGNAKIISLDSNRDLDIQAEWLDQELRENKQTWTIVTFHHPVYSGATGRYNEGINKLWKPILDKYHVDLVLQGHDHTYARGTNFTATRGNGEGMKGTLYVVSVSGEKQYELEEQPWMDRSSAGIQLYQTIEVEKNKMVYKAYTADHKLFDAVEISKIDNGPNVLKNLIP